MSRVCVVGLGKLGAVLAAVLAGRDHKVVGFDISPDIVDRVNRGVAPVMETGLHVLIGQVRENLTATTSISEAVRRSDIAFILVPTPSGSDGRFSNEYVLEAIHAIGGQLHGSDRPYTVVVCSTVMPGSCDGPIRHALEESSGRDDVGLCYSPEFIALGSVIHDMTHPDMVLLGANDPVSRAALFDVLCTIPETTPEFVTLSLVDAEIAKIGVNTYVTMKISFANTIGEICQQLPGADGHRVTAAIGRDSRIGSKYLKPGPAYGGPCFPRDTSAFVALAEEVGVGAQLADATGVVNERQVLHLADSLIGRTDRVSVLGVAYKPDTAVIERSFGRELVELLQFEGITVNTYDPEYHNSVNGNPLCNTAQECVDASDVVVIALPYPQFVDVAYKGKTVIDMWGLLAPDVDCAAIHRFGTW